MDNLLTLARREFPDFEPTHMFDAAIPLFFLHILVEALEPQTLNSFESYFLYAVANNVNTLADIAWLYGINEEDLYAPGANLLKRDYIWQGAPQNGARPIYLTDKGRLALGKDTAPPAPMRRGANLHFNALTWTPIPQEKQLLVSVERMTSDGLCILPPLRYEAPTLGDLTVEKVAAAMHGISFFHNKQIIALLELQRCRPEYLAPVQVICLRQNAEQQQRLAIYRRSIYQRNESAVLQRFFETGKFLIPDDAIALTPPSLQVSAVITKNIAQVANTLTTNEIAVRGLQTELKETSNRHATTQSKDERGQLEHRIHELETALQQKREESELLHKQLEQQQGSFLSTEEHRAVLEQALVEAREELIIVAPWLNRRTCDDALCTLIAQAVKRGVHIRIGYGITERPNDPDVARHRANAQRVIRAMNTAVSREGSLSGGRLEIQRVSDTHQKILICDRAYGVLGSFNWLSYRGELDEQYRNETSIVVREPAAIAELARIALSVWPGDKAP
jgi:hypothetical protein